MSYHVQELSTRSLQKVERESYLLGRCLTSKGQVNQKFSNLTITFLVLGLLAILGPVSFLPFLWKANQDNSVWHWIVASNTLQNVVVGLGDSLKLGITAHLGVAVAMIAALIIETSKVTLGNAASISIARSSGSPNTALLLLWKQIRGTLEGVSRFSIFAFLIPLISSIFAFTQVVSILLVNDLHLFSIPGLGQTFPTTYNFKHPSHAHPDQFSSSPYGIPHLLTLGPTWSRKAPFFPAFAEYSEPPIEQDGVSDTGVTLRALLPYAAQETRQAAQSVKGPAYVVDTRVTCQAPSFDDVSLVVRVGDVINNSLVMRGTVRSSQHTPRLDNNTYSEEVPIQTYGPSGPRKVKPIITIGGPIEFKCSIKFGYPDRNWRISLCQLPEFEPISGGLVSEFQTIPPHAHTGANGISQNYGVAYLVLNFSLGTTDYWESKIAKAAGGGPKKFPPPFYQIRDEWYDLIFAGGQQIFSVSLCYSSFMAVAMPVNMSSSRNRTEPTPSFNFSGEVYDYSSVRKMLGQENLSKAERGILDLEKKDTWVVNASQYPDREPFTRMFANAADGTRFAKGVGNSGNCSILFWDGFTTPNGHAGCTIEAHMTHQWLFQEILQTGGSLAFAVQSILFVLTTISYYEQLPQFTLAAPITRVEFITTNVPQRWRGLLSVLVVTFIHLSMMLFLLIAFLRRSKYSIIGETWHTIAQLVSPDTDDFLTNATSLKDNDVTSMLIGAEREKASVCTTYVESIGRVGLVEAAAAGDGEPYAYKSI